MPTLNKEKCLAQQPIQLSIENEHTVAQEDWLKVLYALAAKQLGLDDLHRDDEGRTAIDYFIKDAEKHTGEFSTYIYKADLLNVLKMLYTAFTSAQVTNDQKTMMALKIQEGAQNCTPGFHTRVQYALELLNIPRNCDGLLAKTRFSIVEQAASITLKDDTQSVHGSNRFFVMAGTMGFGVRPINENDTYINVGGVAYQQMERALNEAFANHYGLFGMLNSLREQIESLVREKGYSGRKETGYSREEQERIREFIKPFISISEDDLFKSHIDEEHYVKTTLDINWQNVKRALFEKLRDEGYIKLSKNESALLEKLRAASKKPKALNKLIPNAHELAQCLVFFSEWSIQQKAAFANAYIKDKPAAEQEAILSVLENQAPQLTKALKLQPEFRTRYFNIAIQKNMIADVRTYIEQGADINAALSLLLSEEHKTETLYWLYEHKHLISAMTPDSMKAIVPSGKYKDKTIAEMLVSTKKGRQVLLENKSLCDLFSESQVAQFLGEKPTVVMPDGLFKRPDPLATQLCQYVAYGDLKKVEEFLKSHAELTQKLLTEKVTVKDYSGRRSKHQTAFQLALCAWDVKLNETDDDAMCEMLAKYMRKEDTEEQYKIIFPEGHQKHFKKQKSFDFTEIIQAIINASIDDVSKALDLIQPNETALWAALQKFRKAFTELSRTETVWNPQHFIEALKQYDVNYGEFGGRENSPKNMLIWRQVIGYTQRFFPANVAMDIVQGVFDRVKRKQKPLRSFNFQYGRGAILPLSVAHTGIGYEFAVSISGIGPRVHGDGGGRWWRRPLGKLLSGRNGNLRKFTQREQSRASCLIV